MSIPVSKRRPEGFAGQRLVVLPATMVAHGLSLPVCAGLLPTHIGRFDRVAGHYVDRPRGTPEYVLILCLSGKGAVTLRRKTHKVEAGDAFLLPPHEAHRYFADDAEPWSKVWVHFTGSQAQAYAQMLLEKNRSPVFHLRQMEVLVEAFEDAYRHVLGGYTDADLFGLSTACARFLGLCRLHQQAKEGRHRDAAQRVVRTIQFMRAHLHRQVSLTELAAAGGWSHSHFSAMFKAQTNSAPLVFFTRLRLQRACELLKTTDDSVAQVAAVMGYEDPFYFSRLFSQHQGLSPKEYRLAYGWSR